MSLILEALRKSEQQRRLGEPPTLDSESAWAARRWHGTSARAARWPWIAGALVLLAVAGGAAWWLRPAIDAEPTPAAEATSAEADTPPAAQTTAAPTGTLPVATAPASNLAPSPPAPVAAPPSTPAVVGAPIDPTIQQRLDVPTPSPDGEYPEVPAPADGVTLQPATPPSPAPSMPMDVAPPTMASPTAAPPAVAPPAAAAAAAPVSAAPAPVSAPAPAATSEPAVAPTAPPSATGDLPLVYTLPLATRQALPPLKMSMHVWNADPARRFVILGDTRAAEGESAGGELSVVEIRRDGVVLDFRGTRFLLPRGGY